MNRRNFIKITAGFASTLFLLPATIRAMSFTDSPVQTNRLRPPGAVPEKLFAGKCIRCGRCVEVCHFHSIKLLDIRAAVFAGTPIITADKTPCYLCMKCTQVCPTGSLKDIPAEKTRMGLAIINRHLCYSWNDNIICKTCYDACPYKEKAIVLDQFRPVVVDDNCLGCGLCCHACPVSNEEGMKAINIEPIYS